MSMISGDRLQANVVHELDIGLLRNISAHLGRGGMGEVYLAEYDGHPVAVKQVNDEYVGLFEREIVIQSMIEHTNLVRVVGKVHGIIMQENNEMVVRPDTGRLLMVLEYCAGGNLRSWLRWMKENPKLFTPAVEIEAISFMADVAMGMHELHQRGIVHCDLKPANVFLSLQDSRLAKVGDFGLANIVQRRQRTTLEASSNFAVFDNCGTPEYVAPECLQTGEVRMGSDVYSFGILLHNVFLTQDPVETYDAWAVLGSADAVNYQQAFFDKLVAGMRPSVTITPSVPFSTETLEAVVPLMQRCWDKEVELRPLFNEIIEVLRALRDSRQRTAVGNVPPAPLHVNVLPLEQSLTPTELATHLAKRDLPPAEHEQVPGLSLDMFVELDRVMKLNLVRNLGLKFAQVVVLGQENIGKSTFLERLTGVPLPKAQGRCTTCVIRIQLRRGPVQLTRVCIRHRKSLDESESAVIAMETMRREVQSRMEMIQRLEAPNIIAVEHEVVVFIQLPFVANLDLVDLPGIVAANEEKRQQDIPSATYDLARSVVAHERERSIFLFVVDCRSAPHQVRVVDLIREFDIEKQTIGVYTKLDVFVKETDDGEEEDRILKMLKDTRLLVTHGWYISANRRPPKGSFSREVDRLRRMDIYEEKLLRGESTAGPLLPSSYRRYLETGRAGLPVIRRKVSLLFEDFLCVSWIPHITTSLMWEFYRLSSAHAALGLPLVVDVDDDDDDVTSDDDVPRRRRELLSRLSAAVESLVPDYPVSIFTPFSPEQMRSMTKEQIKQSVDEFSKNYSLKNFPSVWRAICEYQQFQGQLEAQWAEHKYPEAAQRSASLSLQDGSLLPFVATDKSTLDSYHKLANTDPVNITKKSVEACVARLSVLVDELCNSLDAEALLQWIFLQSKSKFVFERAKAKADDRFPNINRFVVLDRFPAFQQRLHVEVENYLRTKRNEIHEQLMTDLRVFASQRESFVLSNHFVAGPTNEGQNTDEATNSRLVHINAVCWAAPGKRYYNVIIDSFLDQVANVLPNLMQEIEMPSAETFLEERGLAERYGQLNDMLSCCAVVQSLKSIEQGVAQNVFGDCAPTPYQPFDSVSSELNGHTHLGYALLSLPDGHIASGSADKTVRIWDSTDSRCLMTIQCPDIVCSLLYLSDGTLLAGLNGDKGIAKILLEGQGSIISTWQGHSHWVTGLTLLPDKVTVVSCSWDMTLRIWAVEDGRCLGIMKGHSKEVQCVAILPQHSSSASVKVVSGSDDRTLIIWDVTERRPMMILRGHVRHVYSVVCPSSNRIVSGSSDNTIRLWEVSSGQCLRVMRGHTDWVSSLTILSSDVIVSGSSDRTIKIWSLSSGEELQSLSGHKNAVRCLSVLPDGRLVSGAWDNTLRIWWK